MAYEYITKYNYPAHTKAASVPAVFGYTRTIEEDTIHWWGDPRQKPTFDGVNRHFLNQPPNGVSAHYTLEAGRVACGVNEADASHANGNARANAKSVTWECNPRCSDGDYATLADAMSDAWIARGYKKPGVIRGHRDHYNTQCPGNYDLARIRREVTAAFNKKLGKPVSVKPAAVKPKPAPKPKPKPKAEKIVWRMDAGDNLAKIVRYYAGPTAQQIIKANPFMNRATVPLGTIVTIPGKLEWVVERGDTWEKVARYYAVSVAHVKNKNPKIKTLQPGQVLRIQ